MQSKHTATGLPLAWTAMEPLKPLQIGHKSIVIYKKPGYTPESHTWLKFLQWYDNSSL